MPHKNVIAIDFVEDLITMNCQGNDVILNIDNVISQCNSEQQETGDKRQSTSPFIAAEAVAKWITETQCRNY